MTIEPEEWRVVADFPIYAVSSFGRVMRIKPTARGHKVTGRPLKPVTAKGRGYQFVTLCRDGHNQQVRINRMVCEAFHGPPPSERHHAAHCDGDSLNNHKDNLRWATPVENEADKRAHGTARIGERHWSKSMPERRARGERHGLSRLSRSQVAAIKSDRRPQRVVADEFGVSQGTISSIRTGKTWGHV